jgi:hopanoid biosynthesis associated radical SAM protein HpnH
MPLHVTTGMIRLQVRNALRGNRRFPYVLMLEPLYTCNLACIGCAIERHTGKLSDRLPVDRCMQAVAESQAPIVSICGGEPTLYPELPDLLARILHLKRHIYLCTNGLLLDEKVYGVVPPDKRLMINVHLDGLKETHDFVCDRAGVFEKAIAMIRRGLELGHHVMANMTVYKDTDVAEVEALCRLLEDIGVDGMLVTPGYHYESLDQDIFMTRSEIQQKFRRVLEISKKHRLSSTPMFLEFAAGLREYQCSPWSTVTFTPRGWKGPCYLIGQSYTFSWDEFWTKTDWGYWESRQDRRCQNCAMHSGFEASVVRELPRSPGDMVRLAAWNLVG